MRVAVIVTARPSYAKAKTVIAALVRRGADVQILACASALLERYGKVVDVIRKDFPDVPITEVWSTYEGANLRGARIIEKHVQLSNQARVRQPYEATMDELRALRKFADDDPQRFIGRWKHA